MSRFREDNDSNSDCGQCGRELPSRLDGDWDSPVAKGFCRTRCLKEFEKANEEPYVQYAGPPANKRKR